MKEPYYYVESGMLVTSEINGPGDDFGGYGDACWRTGMAFLVYGGITFFKSTIKMLFLRDRWLGWPPAIQGWNRVVYRHRSFTKDQLIPGLAALYLRGVANHIRIIEFPFILSRSSIMRPNIACWIWYLKTNREIWKWLFHAITWLELSLGGMKAPMFSIHNLSWMLYTCPSEKISQKLLEKKIDGRNILLRLLNHDPVSRQEVYSVRHRKGWYWQNDNMDQVPEETYSEYPLDADVVIFIYEYSKKHLEKHGTAKLDAAPERSSIKSGTYAIEEIFAE